jgi:2,3-bisphosphoglycerate-dependent phosphoglycerate mutase
MPPLDTSHTLNQASTDAYADICTDIWFIRHGETDWNAAHRMQGRIDIPLNAAGLAQADALVPLLVQSHREAPFAALYATPLTRSKQTAAPMAAALGVPVGIVADLQERAFGIIEGEPYATVRNGIGRTPILTVVAKALYTRDPDYLPPPGESGDGETLQHFYDSVVRGALFLATQHPNSKVAIVVHGGVLDCLWRWAHGVGLKPHRTWSTVNASINVLRVQDGQATVLAWGVQASDGSVKLDDAL